MSAHVPNKITILAISGSLRHNSSNVAVINTAAAYMKDKVNFVIYDSLATIPPFDDSQETSPAVQDFRRKLHEADGVFICAPEYAFGVSGVLKNALDWTVASGEFVRKPTALITAATGGDKAHSAMLLTLSAMSARVADSSKLLISFVRAKMDDQNNIRDNTTELAIHEVADSLVADIAFQYM